MLDHTGGNRVPCTCGTRKTMKNDTEIDKIPNSRICEFIERYVRSLTASKPDTIDELAQPEGDGRCDGIVKLLVGSSRTTRNGPRPTRRVLAEIADNIQSLLPRNEPIRIAVAWGCRKTWDRCTPGIDLAELFSFVQLAALNESVRRIYSPGIRYSIYPGDSWYEYIYDETDGITEYVQGLSGLTRAFGEFAPQVIPLSGCQDKDAARHKAACDANLALLTEYWYESSTCEVADWPTLHSYRRLCDSGWKGTIPPEMRQYYLDRTARFVPDADRDGLIEAVLKHFAYALMEKQFGLIDRYSRERCTVEFSLRSPPPGMPTDLRTNRLHVRPMPRSVTRKSAPPWTVQGTVTIDEDGAMNTEILSSRDRDLDRLAFAGYTPFQYCRAPGAPVINVPVYRVNRNRS